LDLVKGGTPIVIVSHAFDGLPDIRIHLVVMNEGRITKDICCPARAVEDIVRKSSLRQ